MKLLLLVVLFVFAFSGFVSAYTTDIAAAPSDGLLYVHGPSTPPGCSTQVADDKKSIVVDCGTIFKFIIDASNETSVKVVVENALANDMYPLSISNVGIVTDTLKDTLKDKYVPLFETVVSCRPETNSGRFAESPQYSDVFIVQLDADKNAIHVDFAFKQHFTTAECVGHKNQTQGREEVQNPENHAVTFTLVPFRRTVPNVQTIVDLQHGNTIPFTVVLVSRESAPNGGIRERYAVQISHAVVARPWNQLCDILFYSPTMGKHWKKRFYAADRPDNVKVTLNATLVEIKMQSSPLPANVFGADGETFMVQKMSHTTQDVKFNVEWVDQSRYFRVRLGESAAECTKKYGDAKYQVVSFNNAVAMWV